MNKAIETWVGFFVILISAATVWTLHSSHKEIGSIYCVSGFFDRVDGVLEGSDIRMVGVKVGNVQKIDIDKKSYRAKVILGIDKDIDIPTDSSAEIVSESLMGGKYINLTPGGDDKFITRDGSGSIQHTQSSISIENLIGKYLFSEKK